MPNSKTTLSTAKALLLALALVIASAAPVGASRDLDLDALRAKIVRLERHLKTKQNQRDEQQIQLLELEKNINALERKKAQTDREMAMVAAQMRFFDRQLDSAQGALTEARDTLRRWTQSGYALGKQPLIKLLLSHDNPTEAARTMAYYGYLTRTQKAQFKRLGDRIAAAADLAESQRASGEKLHRLLAAQRSTAVTLQAKRHERQRIVTALSADIDNNLMVVERLRANERRLMKLVKTVQTPARIAGRDVALPTAVSFRDLKGRLRLPLDAHPVATFGQSRSDGNTQWDGILLDAPQGSEFHAVADGTVVYADWFRGFGLLLIVDHGDGFMSLYSHGDEITKSLGDPVTAGEILGKVGVTGGLEAPGLYFEIRSDGRPQDPLLWCKT